MTDKLNLIKHDGIRRHEDPKDRSIVIPWDMSFDLLIETARRIKKEQEQYILTSPVFMPYLLDDGLVAAFREMLDQFGMAQASGNMFRPPEMRSVKIGLHETIEVPFGEVAIPSMIDANGEVAKLYLDSAIDPDHPDRGEVFQIRAYVRRMEQDHITRFVAGVKLRLEKDSIYRGKALEVNSAGRLDFIDLSKYDDETKIVFTKAVQEALDTAIFIPIRDRERCLRMGIDPKSNTLLYGPWGCGKSSAGGLTAKVCMEADTKHTFIACGVNADIKMVTRVAGLYEPSVGFCEDVDNQLVVTDEGARAVVLEAFDGLSAKGKDVKLIMTTNYIENFPPGVTRAGRIDNFVNVDVTDRETMERIIRANSDSLAKNVDFDAVWEVAHGFPAVYVRSLINKASVHALARTPHNKAVVLDTESLVAAANLVRGDYELHKGAGEPEKLPTIDRAFAGVLSQAAQEAVNSDVHKRLLLGAAEMAFLSPTAGMVIKGHTRDGIEDGLNAAALYDKYGEDKKGQIVVE